MENRYFTSTIRSNLSFKGHSLATNEKGEKEYQFYLPVDKQKKVEAEVVLIGKDGSVVKNLTSSLRKIDGEIPVWTLPTSTINSQDVSLAYRFMYDGKPILDNTLRIKDNNYNEAILQSRPALTMPRQMYHLMPDNFNPNNGQILTDGFGNEVQRNHFNIFGGTLMNIMNRFQEIKDFGAKRIISTPIFGDDVVSDHGYWTVNPYKITSSLGSKNDFKKLNIELFRKGLGWVADGAFANEGIEGIHIQDIIRWGENSPYLNHFDIKDFSMNGLKFGVLPPVASEAEKYYDFKIVNSPLLYTFDKNGNPTSDFGKINPNYDKTQPTYLQQFDRRLMDDNYINSPEMLSSYTKKQLEDIHSIKDYKDSVQLIHYNVDPQSVQEKIKEMKKFKADGQSCTHSIYRNMLKKWQYFSLEHVDKEGTIRNWVGKKDIFALNYTNSEVQDYILGVPKYWTNETDKTLTTHISKRLATANTNEEKAAEIQKIAQLFDVNLTTDELKNIFTGNYETQLAPVGNSIKEELKSFPLVASEAPREIAALLSAPSLKNNAEFDKIYEKQIVPLVENIFKTSHPDAFKNGQLTEEGKHIFRLVSGDIMEYISSYLLSGELPKVGTEDGYNRIELPENFTQKVFNNLKYQSVTRTEATDKLLHAFEEGAKKLKNDAKAQADIKRIINNTSNGVDFNVIKTAKSLISRLEAGLEWRIDASKDIVNLDLINQGKANPEKIWKVAADFWKNFVTAARQYNPKSYIIGEVTCMGDYFKNGDDLEKAFIKESGFTTQTNYSYIFNILNRIVHGAPEEAFSGPHHVSVCSENPKAYTLSSALKGFFESGYADNIIYSHESVDNHDKPRALHGYAVDILDFFNIGEPTNKTEIMRSDEFKSLAKMIRENKSEIWGKEAKSMSDDEILNFIRYGENICTDNEILANLVAKDPRRKALSEFRSNFETIKNKIANKKEVNAVRNALIEALDTAKGSLGLTEEQRNAIATAINDYATGVVSSTAAEHFSVRPYNYVIEDAVKRANLNLDKNTTEKIIATIHNEMLKPALSKFRAMFSILVALPGNPTIYAGNEFGETGFESASNNIYQHNRNQIHRDWIKDSNRSYIGAFHDEISKIFSLRNNASFAPFVNGATVVLDNFAGDNVGGVYRYNKDSDVITVFNTNGFSNTRKAASATHIELPSIPVNADFDITKAYGTDEFVRIRPDGQPVTNEFYKIVNNVLKRFNDSNYTQEAGKIEITDCATYFVRRIKKQEQIASIADALRGQTLVQTSKQTAEQIKNLSPSVENNPIVQNITKENKGLVERLKGPVGKGALIFGGVALVSGLIINHIKKKTNDENIKNKATISAKMQ